MKRYIITLLVLVLVLAVACKTNNKAASSQKYPPESNLLVNPGFEEGAAGWKWMDWSPAWAPFDISDKIAHSGKKSALLTIDERPGMPHKKIRGVVQTLKPEQFPEIAAGWYKIEKWNRGVPKQYLQFVVIAWEKFDKFPNYQLRYVLEGYTAEPLGITNAKYTILTEVTEPDTGKWKHFEVRIKDDYERLWGKVPSKYEKLNFFFEARFDDLPRGDAHIVAEVHYDDLYVGDDK